MTSKKPPCADCPSRFGDARKLPERRRNVTFRFQVRRPDGAVLHDLLGTVGFIAPVETDPSTWRARELFITGPKEGTELLSLLQSACLMVSHLLQTPFGPADFDAVRAMLHGGQGDADSAFHIALAEASRLMRDVRAGSIAPQDHGDNSHGHGDRHDRGRHA